MTDQNETTHSPELVPGIDSAAECFLKAFVGLIRAIHDGAARPQPHAAQAAVQVAVPEAPTPRRAAPANRPPGERLRVFHDCRCVVYDGKTYGLTPTQAACLKVLLAEAMAGVPEVDGQFVLVEAESGSQYLSQVFSRHPLWGTLIRGGTRRGVYRLALDRDEPVAPSLCLAEAEAWLDEYVGE